MLKTNMAGKGWRKLETREKDIENGKELVSGASEGDTDTVKSLLEAGVSVNAEEYNRSLFYKSQNYLTPLQCAAKCGHVNVLRLLIEHEADLDAVDRFDVTALHLAAEAGQLDCLQLLLDSGSDCNITTKYSKYGSYTAVPHVGGTLALHLAAKNNHTTCAKELILNGADYNAVDELGRTSLYIAAELGFEDMVMVHLRNAVGRDILSLPVKNTKETPLHECVRKGLRTCVSELLKHGSDVNEKNSLGFSPLHLAVHNTDKFSFDMLQEIVKKGYNVDVNLTDNSGLSLLHYVCFHDNTLQERRPQVAAFLIAYGAEFTKITNKQGFSLLVKELLVGGTQDKVILQAMVKTLSRLPDPPFPPGRRLGQNPVPERDKFNWYMNLKRSVRSLQHYCRCVVRQTLGAKRLTKIGDNLRLPNTLKEYLMLEYDEYR